MHAFVSSLSLSVCAFFLIFPIRKKVVTGCAGRHIVLFRKLCNQLFSGSTIATAAKRIQDTMFALRVATAVARVRVLEAIVAEGATATASNNGTRATNIDRTRLALCVHHTFVIRGVGRSRRQSKRVVKGLSNG